MEHEYGDKNCKGCHLCTAPQDTQWQKEFFQIFKDRIHYIGGEAIFENQKVRLITQFISNLLASERTRLATAVEGLKRPKDVCRHVLKRCSHYDPTQFNLGVKTAAELIRHSPNK